MAVKPSKTVVTSVPFVDLSLTNSPVQAAVAAEHAALVERGAFVNGSAVNEFESAFANYCQRTYCVGLASGLDALRLSLVGMGVEPGSEVIVPAMTFIATFEAVVQAGCVPVPVDVRDDDFCMDPAQVEAAITPRTSAILPVHLYGQLSDMRALITIAKQHDLLLVADACQAHGASRDGISAGSGGISAGFSFYPAKNLGAWGDAGALVTDDQRLAEAVRALREHGQTSKYHSEYVGYTARLDAFQAVVLSQKLRHLDESNDLRRAAAETYSALLNEIGDLRLPVEVTGSHHVWHLYTVRTVDPDSLGAFLAERGIGRRFTLILSRLIWRRP